MEIGMNATNTVPATKPQPVMIFGAVITTLTIIFGGLTSVAGLNDNPVLATICGIGMLVTAALNAGKDFYIKGQVVPFQDVGTYLNVNRHPVDGPAQPEIVRQDNLLKGQNGF